MKKIWRLIYEFLGKSNDLSPKQIVVDGKVIFSPEKLAEAFNNVFLDKVDDLKKNISEEETVDPEWRLASWQIG